MEDFKVVFPTTTTGIHFNNKDETLHIFKPNIVYWFTRFKKKRPLHWIHFQTINGKV